ncbi:MAG TPA: rhodanese-like domain-containing protein [Aequorivita sp.]|jgi:rhodanese-related sulfurtransferase|nr:rhodanese [Aequorivita sp.]HBC05869.1 rhodanese-like domain-containing protein [Aequorivita sp.]HNP69230.1 rhodanese-like domain-containing protein [Aequorivita sp.]|tara:strand:- start:4367 stop:4867 length:501 start_codon:yes stop_codon:yes gene_type:complete
MKIFLSILVCLLFSIAMMAQKPVDALLEQYNRHSVPYISVDELRMFQMNDTVTILDAREPEEFKISHIKSAINVGFNDFTLEEKQLQKLDKNIPVIVYCSVGIRSEKIAEKLKNAGFVSVKNLYGGIFEWKNKGYPVIDSKGKQTENVHAFSKYWSKYLTAGNPVY